MNKGNGNIKLTSNQNLHNQILQFIYIDEKKNILGRSFPFTWPKVIQKVLTRYGCVIAHPAVMMRRDHFETVGRYSEQLGNRFTDYHLWMKFLQTGYHIANLSEPLIQYRLFDDAISSQYRLGAEGSVFLRQVVANKNPSVEEITRLYALCIPEKSGERIRIHEITDFPNRAYTFFRFLGKNLVGSFFSGIKNIYYFIVK